MSQSGISQQTFATLVVNLLLHCIVCYFQGPCAPLPPKKEAGRPGAETMKCGHLSPFFFGGGTSLLLKGGKTNDVRLPPPP